MDSLQKTMKAHVTSFTCKVTHYSLDLRPSIARFTVQLSNGRNYQFTLNGAFMIEQARNDFSRRLAEHARSMQ